MEIQWNPSKRPGVLQSIRKTSACGEKDKLTKLSMLHDGVKKNEKKNSVNLNYGDAYENLAAEKFWRRDLSEEEGKCMLNHIR